MTAKRKRKPVSNFAYLEHFERGLADLVLAKLAQGFFQPAVSYVESAAPERAVPRPWSAADATRHMLAHGKDCRECGKETEHAG